MIYRSQVSFNINFIFCIRKDAAVIFWTFKFGKLCLILLILIFFSKLQRKAVFFHYIFICKSFVQAYIHFAMLFSIEYWLIFHHNNLKISICWHMLYHSDQLKLVKSSKNAPKNTTISAKEELINCTHNLCLCSWVVTLKLRSCIVFFFHYLLSIALQSHF